MSVDRQNFDAVDLFAGPGGWDVAARRLGLRVLGIEWDQAACDTRRAAGLPTLQADVLDVDPELFAGVDGLIASPPCQTFSTAGNGDGRRALAEVLVALQAVAEGRSATQSLSLDERTALVLQPMRWILHLSPRWVTLEQVPPVLPVWQEMARLLRDLGYSVDCGVVSAEQYGVPQTRKRAVLVASLDREVSLPEPTHQKFRKGHEPDRDSVLLPPVTMADALGWGMTARPAMTVTAGGAHRRSRTVRQRSAEVDAS